MATLTVIIAAIYIILLGPILGYLLTFLRKKLITAKIKKLRGKKSSKDDECFVLDTIRNKLVEVKLKELIAQRIIVEMQQVNGQIKKLLDARVSPSSALNSH